jgi:hypothetical protein
MHTCPEKSNNPVEIINEKNEDISWVDWINALSYNMPG